MVYVRKIKGPKFGYRNTTYNVGDEFEINDNDFERAPKEHFEIIDKKRIKVKLEPKIEERKIEVKKEKKKYEGDE